MNRFRILALSTLLVTACGLDLVGTAVLDGGTETPDGMAPDSESPDALVTTDGETPSDAGTDAPVGDACASSCPILDQLLADAGPGFYPAAVLAPDAGCPTGFISSLGFEQPTNLPASACSCGACTADGGACTTSIPLTHGDGNVCDQPGTNPVPLNGGNCQNFSISFSHAVAGTTIPAATTQGNCSVVTNKGDSSKVTAVTSHLICNAPPACAGDTCSLPQGTKICLSALGNVACPASAPNKTKLGTSFDVACSPCGCTAQTICGGTMSLFPQGNCMGTKTDLTLGQCGPSPNDNSSLRVTLNPQTTCANTTPGTPTGATLTGTVGTLCCAN